MGKPRVTLQLRLEHEASALRGRNANHLTLTYVNENANGRNEDKTNLIMNTLSLEALKLKNVYYFATQRKLNSETTTDYIFTYMSH